MRKENDGDSLAWIEYWQGFGWWVDVFDLLQAGGECRVLLLGEWIIVIDDDPS